MTKLILTAINNPKINDELNKEKNINVICKDIQYREAILEILSKNNNVEIIIINNNLPGEISFEELINKIKKINSKIKLIFIFKKEDKKLEEILKNKKIIYYNKLNLPELINIINNKKFKKIENNSRIISILGPANVGKSNCLIKLLKKTENKYNKILLIDFDINEPNLYFLLNKKYKLKKLNYKLINELNNEFKNNYKKINELINLLTIKCDKRIDLISKINLFSNYLNKLNFYQLNLFFEYFFKIIKNKYDLILIDIGSKNKNNLIKLIIKNSTEKIFITKGNLIGINESINFLQNNKLFKINNNFKNLNNKLLINKNSKYNVDFKIIKNIFKNFKVIGIIKKEKIFVKGEV